MFKIQLWSNIKEYYEKNGVKNDESNKDVSYEEMYDEEYCSWLSHFYKCLFHKDCNLEYDDIDDLCEEVWKVQYEIENKLKEDFMKSGDDIMRLEELEEIDKKEIREYFHKNGADDWKFNDDLQKWFNENGQTIREFLLDNVPTNLSPNMLDEFTSELIWHYRLEDRLERLTNVELLSTVISKERTSDGYKVFINKAEINLTPKEWRKVIYAATERFIKRGE